MSKGKIYVAGIGPGSEGDITPAVEKAVMLSDVVVGYKYYFSFIQPFVKPDAECVDTGMRKERDRAAMAFDYAEQGKTVCVISSGDFFERKGSRNTSRICTAGRKGGAECNGYHAGRFRPGTGGYVYGGVDR